MYNPAYIKWIKEQECCHCGIEGCDPHHLVGFGSGKMGGKAGDHLAVPLCRKCHTEFHTTFDTAWALVQIRWLDETLKKAFEEGVLYAK